jgi:hypothetical protein
MSILCQQNRISAPILRKKGHSSNWETGLKTRRIVPAPAAPLLAELPQSRREKILAVRRQIAEGTYNPDNRINAILDRLLNILVA